MKRVDWFVNLKALRGGLVKQRRLGVLVGLMLLWPVFSNWFQRRDDDASSQSNDKQNDGMLIDVSALPGVPLAVPNAFFASSNLDELLNRVSAGDNIHELYSNTILAQPALELVPFTFSSSLLHANQMAINSFLAIPDYQVYMLGDSEPIVQRVSEVKEDADDSEVAWYQDYAHLLLGGLAAIIGAAVYRLHDESPVNNAGVSTISGDTQSAIVEDETSDLIVKTGQLIATGAQGEPVKFDPDLTSSEEDSLGQLIITEDGLWTFTVDNEAIQFLAANEVLEQVFVVRTRAGLEQQIVVRILGENDAPELEPISLTVVETAAPFTLDLLLESNATDVDGDNLFLVSESVRIIDDSIDAGGVVFDEFTNTLQINPGYYSYLGEGETVNVRYSFSVTDGLIETSTIATLIFEGDALPTVDIIIDQSSINDIAIINSGSTLVSFVFSEAIVGFDETDIVLSLGQINNLRQDADDELLWFAELVISDEDMASWQYGQIATLAIEPNRFSDTNDTLNITGDLANYLVIFDRDAIIGDAIAVVDNFIHPKHYYSDANPNLLFEGTDGNDYIDAFTGDNIIYGLAGDDILVAAGNDDVFIGGAGDDLFIDGAGDDVYIGGSGDDTLLLSTYRQEQDIFVGGAGFDRVLVQGSLSDFNVAFANPEQVQFVNDLLITAPFNTGDVSNIMNALQETNEGSLDPFIELMLTSYAADGILTIAERAEFAADYGNAALELLMDLPAFRGISLNDIEGLNVDMPVIDLQLATLDASTRNSSTLIQAESIIFDDGVLHIMDGIMLTSAEGTQETDWFLLALPSQYNPQLSLTFTLNDFNRDDDSIIIEGLFERGENEEMIQVDAQTLLDKLQMSVTDDAGQIDLSGFVDKDSNALNGEIIVNFSPEMVVPVGKVDVAGIEVLPLRQGHDLLQDQLQIDF
jgi:VCBS repeat-containing protein